MRILTRQGNQLLVEFAIVGANGVAQNLGQLLEGQFRQYVDRYATTCPSSRATEAESGVLAAHWISPGKRKRVVRDADAYLPHVIVQIMGSKILVAVWVATFVDDHGGNVVDVVGLVPELDLELRLMHQIVTYGALELVAALVRVDLHRKVGGDVVDDTTYIDEARGLDVEFHAVANFVIPQTIKSAIIVALHADEHLTRAVAVFAALDFARNQVLDLLLAGAVGDVNGELMHFAVIAGESDWEFIPSVCLCSHPSQLSPGREMALLIGVDEHVHKDLPLAVKRVESEFCMQVFVRSQKVAHVELILESVPDVGC
ncbi:type I restriction enzymeP M, putative [Babesia ovata]|uniref:Type I restriction enzymeP M, putative n=1 Tax=Babesia ovata TaxID=189622 RepID=A0A2H6KF44_9APIC|nr:type I restriction enzymeP M, putative [Babesia ovata]GBE61620.1 type I restriction enzymeP M, putative [Babesia ovata]